MLNKFGANGAFRTSLMNKEQYNIWLKGGKFISIRLLRHIAYDVLNSMDDQLRSTLR